MIEHLVEMEAEHDAWLLTVAELREATGGESWNDEKWTPLANAVILWGERLVALRVEQTEEVRAQALAEAARRTA